MCEYAGLEAALDDPYREAKTFYITFGLVTLLGSLIVMIPNAPLVTILVATQVLNAVLLIPLLFVMIGIGRDEEEEDDHDDDDPEAEAEAEAQHVQVGVVYCDE